MNCLEREARDSEWRRLKRKGLSYCEIGRRYGVHRTTVMYALKAEYRARKQNHMENYNLKRRGEYLARLDFWREAAE